MNDAIKVRIMITKGHVLLHEFHSDLVGGRHELSLGEPMPVGDRLFTGIAIECHLDRAMRRIEYPTLEIPDADFMKRLGADHG